MEGVLKEKPALASLLAQHSSFEVSQDSIDIVYEGERTFYGPTVRPDTKLMERIASDVAGRPMRLRIVERGGTGSIRLRRLPPRRMKPGCPWRKPP